ncbi:MAG: cupin domain-containing protein [Spirosoma sp.]|nr:cupin domain-containing protein [Spirosoma sp.]
MFDRRKLLKNVGLLAGTTVLPFADLLAKDKQLNKNPSADKLLPVLIQPEEGEKAISDSTSYTRKILKQHTGGAFSSLDTVLKNGYLGAPPHLHQELDELMYVIDGTVTVMVGDDIVEVKSGAWHLRPRKIMHCFWNTCGKDAHVIDMFLPGGFEDYLFELNAIYKKFGKIDPAEVEKFIHKYDIELHFELLEPILKKYQLKF